MKSFAHNPTIRLRARLATGAALPVLAGLVWAPAALGQDIDPTLRPTARSVDCTTGGCHAETLDHKYQHGPTAVFDCRACHDDHDEAAHTFVLKFEGRGLCDFCHIDKTGTEGPVVHEPLGEGKCLECHDPHGSEHRKMLIYDTMGELCLSCHTETLHGDWLHEPAAQGDCTACHSPHTADFPGLLVQERRSLCLSCHEAMATHLASALNIHEPVAEGETGGDCLECHRSHAADHSGLLVQSSVELCTSCHEEQLFAAQQATFPHSAVLEDRACLNCHVPHASSQAALQYDDPVAACMACHSGDDAEAEDKPKAPVNPAAPVFHTPKGEKEETEKVKTPAPVASELRDRLPISHGPVKDAQCGACHEVHGSDHSRLLIANFTENFYEDFHEEAYALCLSCHDRNLLLEDHTWEATRFRDGEKNLHAFHVKGEQGRTCRACHNTHASKSPAMVRESSPYGQWMLPLNFEMTEFGGSCAPGCHKAATYTRSDPPEGVVLPSEEAAVPPPEAAPTTDGAAGEASETSEED